MKESSTKVNVSIQGWNKIKDTKRSESNLDPESRETTWVDGGESWGDAEHTLEDNGLLDGTKVALVSNATNAKGPTERR